jgi:hypothetical protein
MAALTASSVQTHSVGDLTLKIVALTIQGTSDTYTLYAGAPIVGAWVNGIIGENVTYVASTGVFTLTNASGTGAVQLFILLAGA